MCRHLAQAPSPLYFMESYQHLRVCKVGLFLVSLKVKWTLKKRNLMDTQLLRGKTRIQHVNIGVKENSCLVLLHSSVSKSLQSLLYLKARERKEKDGAGWVRGSQWLLINFSPCTYQLHFSCLSLAGCLWLSKYNLTETFEKLLGDNL